MAMLAILALASAAHAQGVDWTGGWDSVWRGGGAAVYLEQEGNVVTGSYAALEGTITGEARGRVLIGTWREPGREGTFIFAMSPDGETFTGRFGNGEWWNGQRMPDSTGVRFTADASSPQNALRTVMVAANLARDHRYDSLAGALSVIDFSGIPAAERATAGDRLNLVRKFIAVLDQLTFRLWDIPQSVSGDAYEAVLRQAGTDVSFPVSFRYGVHTNGMAGWLIVMPAPDVLDRALAELEAARHAGDGDKAVNPLESPRATMKAFIDGYDHWVETGDPSHMLPTLRIDALPQAGREAEALRRAEYLRGVIDRIGYLVWQEIPDAPDSGEAYSFFVHPRGTVEILPFEDGDRHVWQFSPATLAGLPDLYVAMEDMPIATGLAHEPSSLFLRIRQVIRGFDRRLLDHYLGVELWKLIALAGIFMAAVVLAWLVRGAIRLALALGSRRTGEAEAERPAPLRPLGIIIVASAVLVTLKLIWFPPHVSAPLRSVAWIFLIIAGGWLAYRLVDLAGRLAGDPSSRIRTMDELSRSIVVSVAKIAVVVGALLVGAEVFDIPWEGVLAGLGIGGIAVALAARSTVENFIGGLTLLADKPVRAGDFCQFGDRVGTVESLGLRSIKIRSLERTLYTIPNADFINLYLENFTKRDSILFRTNIGVRYETTPDQMRWLLAEIRRLLLRHPRVKNEPARARFVGFGEYCLQIEIFCYVNTSDFNEYLGIREDLYFRLADIVAASGTSFAFPSSVNYIARDTGVDREAGDRAEAAVEAWRRNDRLPFPDFPTQEQWDMINTLTYPGQGSPDSPQARDRTNEAS